jgi:glycosyltransferase involved in cell wall biosynthesis
MQVAVDVRYSCEPFGSMTVFCGNLLRALGQMDPSAPVAALIPRELHPSAHGLRDELGSSVKWVRPQKDRYGRGRLAGELWWVQVEIPRLLSHSVLDADLLITTYHHPPAVTRGVKRVAVVHDLCGLGLGFPKHKKAYWRHYMRLRAATHFPDVIWPISRSTSEAMAARFRASKRRLGRVMYNGVSREPVPPDQVRGVLSQFGLNHGDYIVAFATCQARKNFTATVGTLTELRERGRPIQLVGIAPKGEVSDIRDWCDAEGLHDAIVLSALSDSVMDGLYAGALALLWPSTCEGFGYPVVEAMRQGCPPIVCSAGPGAELVDGVLDPLPSLEPQAIADSLERLRHLDGDSRESLAGKLRLRSEFFSIKSYQERLIVALNEAQERP